MKKTLHDLNNSVILVDLAWVVHKSWFAFNHFTYNNIKTGALYGVIRDLHLLRRKFKVPIFVALEPESNEERYKINPEYKLTRKKVPGVYDLWDDTLSAISLIPGVHIISSDSSGEADDIIYSLVHEFNKLNLIQKFLIYSTDNDLLQIGKNVPNVYYISLKKSELIPFGEYCYEKYGVTPRDILMYRSIIGDTSDNISSVKPRFNRKFAKVVAKQFVSPAEYPTKGGNSLKFELSKYKNILMDNFNKWQKNYSIMELKKLKLINIYPECKPIDYFIERYGLQSFNKYLS